MANPFPAHFDSDCNSCGDPIEEGERVFVHDGLFICGSCAHDAECVCECGKYKNPKYDECYECHNEGGSGLQ